MFKYILVTKNLFLITRNTLSITGMWCILTITTRRPGKKNILFMQAYLRTLAFWEVKLPWAQLSSLTRKATIAFNDKYSPQTCTRKDLLLIAFWVSQNKLSSYCKRYLEGNISTVLWSDNLFTCDIMIVTIMIILPGKQNNSYISLTHTHTHTHIYIQTRAHHLSLSLTHTHIHTLSLSHTHTHLSI